MRRKISLSILFFFGSSVLLFFQNCGKVNFDKEEPVVKVLCATSSIEIQVSPLKSIYELNENVTLQVLSSTGDQNEFVGATYEWTIESVLGASKQIRTETTPTVSINTGSDFNRRFNISVGVTKGEDCAARVATNEVLVRGPTIVCDQSDISQIAGANNLSVNQSSPYSMTLGDCNNMNVAWSSAPKAGDPLNVNLPTSGTHEITPTTDPKRMNLKYHYAGRYILTGRATGNNLNVPRTKEILVEAACSYNGTSILYGQPAIKSYKRGAQCGQCVGVDVRCTNQGAIDLTALNGQAVVDTDETYTYTSSASCVAANACPPPQGCSLAVSNGTVTAAHNGSVVVYQRDSINRTCTHACSQITLSCNNGSFRLGSSTGTVVTNGANYYTGGSSSDAQNSCVQRCTQCSYKEAGSSTIVRVNVSATPVERFKPAASCGTCSKEQFLCNQARADAEGNPGTFTGPFQFSAGYVHATSAACTQSNACPVCPQNLPLHASTGAVVATGGYGSTYNAQLARCDCNNGLKTKRADDTNADGIKDGTSNTPATGAPTACVQACTPGAGPSPDDLATIDAATGQYGCYGCRRFEVDGRPTDGLYYQGKCHYCKNSDYNPKWRTTLTLINGEDGNVDPIRTGQTYKEVNGYYCQETNCNDTPYSGGQYDYHASMNQLNLNLYNCTRETTTCPIDHDDNPETPDEHVTDTQTYQRRYQGGFTVSDYQNYGCTSQYSYIWLNRLNCTAVQPWNTIHLYQCQRYATCATGNCGGLTPGGGGPGGGFNPGGGVWGP